MIQLVAGFLSSTAYPPAVRLGITGYWQPASIREVFLPRVVRQSVIITQWLLLWFYAQKVYFAQFNVVEVANPTLVLSLAFFGLPRVLWRPKKRLKRKKRRFAKRIRAIKRRVPRVRRQRLVKRYLVETRTFQHFRVSRRKRARTKYFFEVVIGFGFMLKKQFWYFKKFHRRSVQRLHKGGAIRFKRVKRLFLRKRLRTRRQLRFQRVRLRLGNGNGRAVFYRFRLRRRKFLRHWISRVLHANRSFYKRKFYGRFCKQGLVIKTRILTARLFWYLKVCFECYFQRDIRFSLINLYHSYFQPVTLPRVKLISPLLVNAYLRAIDKKQRLAVVRRRRRSTSLAYRPQAGVAQKKFTYAQIMLFLSLEHSWQKIKNSFVLCYLIVVSALQKNITLLGQWLYNTVSQGYTRRSRLMRMRYFGLLAKVLRDYSVFGKYLRGFRIEVRGRLSRNPKTRTQFFGDHSVRFSSFGLRVQYQRFDVPTFAGLLGVRFWLF